MANDKSQPPPISLAKSTAENIKDTLESIVVAFILAFVFRAFIVEAFVIPTGSMAATLYGNQVTTTCSLCGWEYARGIDATEEANTSHIALRCPNCNNISDFLGKPKIKNPSSGDRILVHKWPFDSGISALGPRRWEVTVFKDPMDGTTNFIKRLVGLPGEVLEIMDGDVYVAPFKDLESDPALLTDFDRLREDVYRFGQREPVNAADIKTRYDQINERLLPHLKIQRKLLQSPRAQEALWVNVYDHDYLPNYGSLRVSRDDQVGWFELTDPAQPAPAEWKTGQREISFKASGPNPSFIQFGGKTVDNFAGYNAERGEFNRPIVGDVRLRFTWFPAAGDGWIEIQLNRDDIPLRTEIRADGSVSVFGGNRQRRSSGPPVIGTGKLPPFAPGRPVRIEFVNVDYLVRLTIDGETIVQSTDEQYAPDPQTILGRRRDQKHKTTPTQIKIGAKNMEGRLRHVVIERDVFYTNPVLQAEQQKSNPYEGWPGWGTANRPIMLRPERTTNGAHRPAEYFMLGDNSPQSKDSRLWWEIGPHLKYLGSDYQVGTATGDQLIGKAFFVYWPAGYRPSWGGDVGFIPNVGQMRWIR